MAANEMTPGLELYLEGLRQRDLDKAMLQGSLRDAASISPADAAEKQRLAKAYGVSPDNVASFRDEAKQELLLMSPGVSELYDTHPKTARFLSSPDNAEVGHTSIRQMTFLEKALDKMNNVRKSVSAGIWGFEEGLAGVVEGVVEASEYYGALLDKAVGLRSYFGKPVAIGRWKAGEWAEGWRKYFAYGREFDTPEEDGLIEGSIYGGIQSLTSNVLNLPLGVLGKAPYLFGLGAQVFGQSYGKAEEQGLDPGSAVAYGVRQGLAEIVTEAAPAFALFKDFKAGSSFFKTLLNQAATEVPGEQLATIIQDFDDWATLRPDAPFAEYLRERPSAAAQTLIATMVGVGGMTGIVHLARRVTSQERKVEASKHNAEVTAAVEQALEAAELSKVSPDKTAEFLNQAASGTEAENVFFDANRLREIVESSGVTLEELQQKLPMLVDQLTSPGVVDVVLPVGDYFAFAVPLFGKDALASHVRFAPDQISLFDLPEAEREATAMRVEAETLATEEAGRTATFRQEMKEIETELKRRLLPVADVALDKRAPAVVAGYLARLYETAARDMGISPRELFSRYDYTITRQKEEVFRSERPKAAVTGEARGAKGAYVPEERTSYLFEKADASTVIHETSHFLLDMYLDLAGTEGVTEKVRSNMKTLLDWFGVHSIDAWRALPFEKKRKHHETFAYNYERYLYEGVAPAPSLRSLFRWMSGMLRKVYRSIAGDLNRMYRDETGEDLPVLTRDVRMVFDAMLGAERDAMRVEATDGSELMFPERPENIPDNVWQAYRDLAEESRETAVEQVSRKAIQTLKWYGGARNRILRALQGEAKQTRDKVRKEVEAATAREPLYQVVELLRRGTAPSVREGEASSVTFEEPVKLDYSAIKQMYEGSTVPPPDFRRLGFGKYGMLAGEQGFAPDDFAAVMRTLFPAERAFSSGDALVRSLVGLTPFKAEVEARTDRRMLAEHSDLLDESLMDAAAREALHNDVVSRLAAAEIRMLSRVNTPAAVFVSAARLIAEDTVSRTKVGSLRPRDASVAAQKLSREALKAVSRGDNDAAVRAKQVQLIQSETSRAAAKQQTTIKQWVRKTLPKVRKAAFHQKAGAEGAEHIRHLLSRVGLFRASEVPKSALMDYVQRVRAEGFPVGVPAAWMLEPSVTIPHTELTVGQFTELMRFVDQLSYASQRVREMHHAQTALSINGRASKLADSVVRNARKVKIVKARQTALDNLKHKAVKFHWEHITMATIARILDGGKEDGLMWNTFIKPANDIGNKEVNMQYELDQFLSKTLKPVFDAVRKKDKGFLVDRKVFIPELQGSRWFPEGALTTSTMFSVLLNYGNEGNASRMRNSEGWTDEQIHSILSRFTEAELLAAQEIGRYFERFRPEVARIERALTGAEPDWVEPRPFDVVSAEGKTVHLDGWYFPIRYDNARKGFMDNVELPVEKYARHQPIDLFHSDPMPIHWYTKPRADELAHPMPLLLDISIVFSGANEVIHDISWREFLLDRAQLVKQQEFKEAVDSRYGQEVYNEIIRWLDDIAVGDRVSDSAFEQAIGILSSSFTFSRMAFNFMPAALQTLGFTQSVVRLGKGDVREGARLFLKGMKIFMKGWEEGKGIHNTAFQEALQKSALLLNRNRTTIVQRDIRELRNEFRGKSTVYKAVMTHGLVMIIKMQAILDAVTWLGKYHEEVAFVGEEKAVALADQVVIDSQGGGMTKDLPANMRAKGFQRLFTAFYTFANTTLNLLTVAIKTSKSRAALVAQLLTLLVFPRAVESFVRGLLRPDVGSDDDDDPEKKGWRYLADTVEYTLNIYLGGREIGQIAHYLLNTGDAFDYKGPSRLHIVPDLLHAAKQTGQREIDAALMKSYITLGGDLFGLPSGQLNKVIGAIDEYGQGNIDEVELLGGLVFGVEKK